MWRNKNIITMVFNISLQLQLLAETLQTFITILLTQLHDQVAKLHVLNYVHTDCHRTIEANA